MATRGFSPEILIGKNVFEDLFIHPKVRTSIAKLVGVETNTVIWWFVPDAVNGSCVHMKCVITSFLH